MTGQSSPPGGEAKEGVEPRGVSPEEAAAREKKTQTQLKEGIAARVLGMNSFELEQKKAEWRKQGLTEESINQQLQQLADRTSPPGPEPKTTVPGPLTARISQKKQSGT